MRRISSFIAVSTGGALWLAAPALADYEDPTHGAGPPFTGSTGVGVLVIIVAVVLVAVLKGLTSR